MSDRKKVLVADDDLDVVDQLRAILGGLGFEVAAASSHDEAEQTLMGFHPDLAVVDLMMEKPDSGFVLCHQIRKLYPETPIIILTSVTAATGMSFDSHSDEARSWIKADRIMDKPVRAEQLRLEISKLLCMPTAGAHGNH